MRLAQKLGGTVYYCDTGIRYYRTHLFVIIHFQFYTFTDSIIFDFPKHEKQKWEQLKKAFKLNSKAYGAQVCTTLLHEVYIVL